ncbi:Sedoheptulose 17-bisphosphatase [Spathaspora sp. JA1]|nr:Sedoheptulose 17-bisphosphatase [Spathaspora sp. JA1]
MTKAPCPRVIFVRHGQTEWSKSGQHTSRTDLDLTDFGVKQMRNTGTHLIGNGFTNMIKPKNITHIFVSPRLRARHTAELLLEKVDPAVKEQIPIVIDEDIREWEYGDYEGLKTNEIIELRKSRGLDQDLAPGDKWNIFRDGCENGEDNKQVKERLDRFISKIHAIHAKSLENNEASDVIVIAHGHILRCFCARWVQRELNCNPQLMLDAGGVGVLSYQHHNVAEPAIYLAGAFTVPVEEEGADF